MEKENLPYINKIVNPTFTRQHKHKTQKQPIKTKLSK